MEWLLMSDPSGYRCCALVFSHNLKEAPVSECGEPAVGVFTTPVSVAAPLCSDHRKTEVTGREIPIEVCP